MVVKSVISNARIRGHRFLQLFGWLGAIVVRHFFAKTMISAAATVLSLAFQGVALIIVIGAITQFQSAGELTSFPGFDRMGIDLPPPSIEVVLAVFIGIYLIGAAFTYIGRWRAIQLESYIYRHFYDTIVDYFTQTTETGTNMLDTIWERRRIGKRYEVMRIASSDARFAGIITRLILFNIAHLGHIAVGTLIIALYAPFILTFIGALAVISLAVMYPLSLQATRVSRQLEEETPKRTLEIRNALGHLASGKSQARSAAFVDEDVYEDIDDDNVTSTAPAEQDAVESYLSALQKRLQVIELSRVTMSTVIGFGIGILVWLLFSGDYDEVINYGSVLVLFFGLRFGMTGIQGTMVTLTNVNRFLPSVLRLEELMLALGPAECSSETVAANGHANIAREKPPHGVGWRIDTPGLQCTDGILETTQRYVIMLPAESSVPAETQIGQALRFPQTNAPDQSGDITLSADGSQLHVKLPESAAAGNVSSIDIDILVNPNPARIGNDDLLAFVSDGSAIVCALRLAKPSEAASDFIGAVMSGQWRDGRDEYERRAST